VTSKREEHGAIPEIDLRCAAWRKSTHSGGNGSCVEIADLGRTVAVRDSKDPDGPKIIFTQRNWGIFIQSMKTRWLFSHLVARALGPDESRVMIAALAERMA
jgi:Domain of unknown function (DUF397)